MKQTLLSFFLFLVFALPAQVIPNGDFEVWVPTLISSLVPEHWQTGNVQLSVPVYPDSAECTGELAMRVEAIPTGVGSYGHAMIEIPTDYIPASLDFCAKWERTITAAAYVQVHFMHGENNVYNVTWYAPTINSDWTDVSIPMDQIKPVITKVRIEVAAAVGDLVAGEAWISVDNMRFMQTTTVPEYTIEDIELYPNPSVDQIQLGLNETSSYQIWDLQGRMVSEGRTEGLIDVGVLSPGGYQIFVYQKGILKGRNTFIKTKE